MATKTITLQPAALVESSKGQVASSYGLKSNVSADWETADPSASKAEMTFVSNTGSTAGHVIMKLYDKNNTLAHSLAKNMSTPGSVGITADATVAGLTEETTSFFNYHVDAASFSTGKIVFEFYGKIDSISIKGQVQDGSTLPNVQTPSLNGAVLGNGVYIIEVPFTVSES